MAITVRNVLELPSLREFRLAAGEAGLANPVKNAGIVDYEFVEGYPLDKEQAFERNSFVISSLLFAREDEAAVYRAVASLIDYGVSALGIKTVFFRELPEDVKRLADREGLAVFFFDRAFFEDVISDLREVIRDDQLMGFEAERLTRLYRQELSPAEVKRIGYELHPALRVWVRAYYCERESAQSDWEKTRVLNNFARHAGRKQETAAFRFNRGLLFFVSGEEREEKRFSLLFSDALHCAGLREEELRVGVSKTRSAESGLGLALREAVCAQRAAHLKELRMQSYENMGSMKILLCEKNKDVLLEYAGDYLAPMERMDQEGNVDFFRTAAEYVRSGGSIPETARRLFVHENTVRYRVGRIRERLDPSAAEYEFFQNLAAAVWITLAKKEGFI